MQKFWKCIYSTNICLFVSLLQIFGLERVPQLLCLSSQILLAVPLPLVQSREELCQHSLAGRDLWRVDTVQNDDMEDKGLFQLLNYYFLFFSYTNLNTFNV